MLPPHKAESRLSAVSVFVEMVSESWNSLVEYVETWYPLIKALEEKRLEAQKLALTGEIVSIRTKVA